MQSLTEIKNLVYSNPAWAIRNADKVIKGTSTAISEYFSPTNQNDAASRGDYTGNGAATVGESYIRTYKDDDHTVDIQKWNQARALSKSR